MDSPPKPRYGCVVRPENMSMAGKSGISRIDNVAPSYLFKCLYHPKLLRKFELYPGIERLILPNLCLKFLADFTLKEEPHISGLPPIVLLEVNNSILSRRKIQASASKSTRLQGHFRPMARGAAPGSAAGTRWPTSWRTESSLTVACRRETSMFPPQWISTSLPRMKSSAQAT